MKYSNNITIQKFIEQLVDALKYENEYREPNSEKLNIPFLIAGLDGYNEPFKFRKTISKSIIGCVVMTIITIMTPNTETIYTMAVVKEITPDNIQAIGKTGKDVVDYITDQIDKIVNEDDEKENK